MTKRKFANGKHLFVKGHPFFPPKPIVDDDKHAVEIIKRQIRASYGWRYWSKASRCWRYPKSILTPDQAAFLDVAARARHRLQKFGNELSVAEFGTLANVERKALRAMYGGPT
jgi:hypothetical protein